MNCSVTLAGIDACSYGVWSTVPGSMNGDTTTAGTRTPNRSKSNFGVVDVNDVGVRDDRRNLVIVESPVLVPDDEEHRRLPDLIVRSDRVVDLADEAVAGHDIVIRMLVAGERTAVIDIVGLDERVLRQAVLLAVALEIAEQPEVARLIREQEGESKRAARGIVVVDLALLARLAQPLIDARPHAEVIGRHVEPAERRAEVSERAVRQRRSWHRREPRVAHGIRARQRGQHRELLGLEAPHHDVAFALPGELLVVLHEARHVGIRDRAAVRHSVHLHEDIDELVAGIDQELSLAAGARSDRDRLTGRGVVRVFAGQRAADRRVLALEQPQQVIERAVLHHQHDDVLYGGCRHRASGESSPLAVASRRRGRSAYRDSARLRLARQGKFRSRRSASDPRRGIVSVASSTLEDLRNDECRLTIDD